MTRLEPTVLNRPAPTVQDVAVWRGLSGRGGGAGRARMIVVWTAVLVVLATFATAALSAVAGFGARALRLRELADFIVLRKF